jgi:uncharacterized protein YegP (UPF0339 family)
MKQPRFEVYQSEDGWRWRFISSNGRIMADSGEAYASRSGAMRALKRFELLILLQSEHGYV